jgi:hypothetical protein
MTWQLQLTANVERPESDADTARLLRAWFTGAFESMGGALREKLLAVQPLPADVAKSWAGNGPYGPESGGVWSQVTSRVMGPRGLKERTKPFTDKSWAAFLQGLDEIPHQSEFVVRDLGADGYPGDSMLWVTARFNEESDPKFRQYDGRWLFLNVSFSPELLDDPEYQKSVLTFARGIADQAHLAYAEVSYDRGSGRTTFENVFRGMPKRTALESRRTPARLRLADGDAAGDRRPAGRCRRAPGKRRLRRGGRAGRRWLLAARHRELPGLRPGGCRADLRCRRSGAATR